MPVTGVTTTTQIDKAVNTYVAKALEVREHAPVMMRLMDTRTLPRGEGGTYHEPWFAALTAVALTDGEEYDSPERLGDEETTYVPGEVGSQVLITKRTNDIVSENLFAIAGRLQTNAVETKRDTDNLSLLDGFAASVGSGTATLVAGHIGAAAAIIRSGLAPSGSALRTGARSTGDPPEGPIYAVVHEYNRYDLASQFSGLMRIGSDATIGTNAAVNSFTNNGGMTSEIQRRWVEEHVAGKVHGVSVITDGNLAIASTAIKGAVFAKEALVHLRFRGINKKQVETDDGRAIKMTLVDDYGYGERNDAWGIELHLDASAPTT
jgi:hypothetical protein